jgi:hypothetical protein
MSIRKINKRINQIKKKFESPLDIYITHTKEEILSLRKEYETLKNSLIYEDNLILRIKKINKIINKI